MIITKSKIYIYDVCLKCGQLVRLNKPFIGSLHLCSLTDKDLLLCNECGNPITKKTAIPCPDEWKFYDIEKVFFCVSCFHAISLEM